MYEVNQSRQRKRVCLYLFEAASVVSTLLRSHLLVVFFFFFIPERRRSRRPLFFMRRLFFIFLKKTSVFASLVPRGLILRSIVYSSSSSLLPHPTAKPIWYSIVVAG